MAVGITTGMMGTTAKENKFIHTSLHSQRVLTPADKGHDDNVSRSDLDKDNGQFLEHEHGLCSHPHHGNQSEVVDEDRHCDTAFKHVSPVNTHHKHHQHGQERQTELDMELGSISLAKFST